MNLSNRLTLLGILLLAVLPAHALAEVVLKHNDWYISSPSGPYGVYEYRTGGGLFDTGTEVCFGPHFFEIPAPLFAVLAVCLLPVLGFFALYLRGFLPRPGATNYRAGGDGGTALLRRAGRQRPAAPHHER